MKNIKKSAGILLYRFKDCVLQFFLVHPGGPFWAKKDVGAWSIPKGEFTDEDALEAAKRELEEETGMVLKAGKLMPLTPVTLKSGKIIYAWACESDCDPANIKSNTFTMEWPPKTGKIIEVAEVDRAGWFNTADSMQKLNAVQAAFIVEATGLIKP